MDSEKLDIESKPIGDPIDSTDIEVVRATARRQRELAAMAPRWQTGRGIIGEIKISGDGRFEIVVCDSMADKQWERALCIEMATAAVRATSRVITDQLDLLDAARLVVSGQPIRPGTSLAALVAVLARFEEPAIKPKEDVPPRFTYSLDGHYWQTSEDMASREDAIAMARKRLQPSAKEFYTARAVPQGMGAVPQLEVVDILANEVEIPDGSDNWPDCTPAQERELNQVVNQAIAGWVLRNELVPPFFECEELEVHVVDPEAAK